MTQPAPTDAARTAAQSVCQLVNRYLDAFYVGDFEAARSVVADGFSFRGPFVEVAGKEPFFTSAEGLRHIVKGHRLLRQWEQGNEVSSIYEVRIETPAAAGAVTMSEWHTADGDQLVSGRVLFDTAAFRALLPAN